MGPVRNIVRLLIRRYASFAVMTTLLFAGFEFIIPAVIATLDVSAILGDVLARLPPVLAAGLGQQMFGGLGTAGLIGFGWNHPVAHAAGTALAVVLGARAVAGEIETGTLELVLAQPITRGGWLAANVMVAGMALASFCLLGVFGTALGARVFEIEPISFAALLQVGVNLFLLLSALFTASLLASTFHRESGPALAIGFLLAVGSFLVNAIAALWPAAAFLEPYALHSYYMPREVLTSGSLQPTAIGVLCGCVVITLGAAVWRFSRRDVP
jgi:ABC-2 type transport system permease protein